MVSFVFLYPSSNVDSDFLLDSVSVFSYGNLFGGDRYSRPPEGGPVCQVDGWVCSPTHTLFNVSISFLFFITNQTIDEAFKKKKK